MSNPLLEIQYKSVPIEFTKVKKVVEVIDHESIGRSVRNLRQEQGLTLEQAANKIGLSLGYLSTLERGSSRWSVGLVNRVNRGLLQ